MRLIILSSFILLAGCVNMEQQSESRDQQFAAGTKQIIASCKDQKDAKVYKTRLQMVEKCNNPQILDLAQKLNIPNQDLLRAILAKQEELAEKRDRHKITEAEANSEYSQFMVGIANNENQRNATIIQQNQNQQMINQQAVAQLQQQLQFQQSLQQQQYLANKPVTCNTNRMGNFVNTSCY